MLAALMIALAVGGQAAAGAPAQGPGCRAAIAGGPSPAAAELCLGDEEDGRARELKGGAPQRMARLKAAAEHYRRAATLAIDSAVKVQALESLARTYDPQHLDDSAQEEDVLRELIYLQPQEIGVMLRLAALQERQGLLEAAEATLLAARHQQPAAADAYRRLAQFYARRATALHTVETQKTEPASTEAGRPDAGGVFQVGGVIQPPRRLDRPVYPPEATAAGIEGVVILEVVINEAGDVVEPKVVRSIPLLDEAAVNAVRHWHFEPTLLNGRPIPVRMHLTVNFTSR